MARNPTDILGAVPAWGWGLLALAAATASAWLVHGRVSSVTAIKVAEAKAWNIRGPPCPALSKDAFLEGRKRGPRTFVYEGVRFYRRSGYADCAAIYYDGGKSDRFYAVCQFTSPGQLLIRTRKGDFYFEPGPGEPATVSTAHDEARCVLGSHVTLATVRALREGAGQ